MEGYPYVVSMPALQGIAITFTTLSILLTIARLGHNWRASHRFHVDDIFNAIATFLLIPYTAGSLIDDEVQYNIQMFNLGRSSHLPPLGRIQNAFKMEVACTVFFWLILYAAKATFLTIYWRIFCSARVVRNVWFAVAAITALFFGIIFLSVFWVCGSPSRVGGLEACRSMGTAAAVRLLTIWCALNLVDLTILTAFPFAIIFHSRTHLDARQKLAMSTMFLLALFFIALDVLRTYYNLSISLGATTNLIFVWRILEPNVAVMLSAISGFAHWCRMIRSNSSIADDNHSWVEIGDIGKDVTI